MHRFLRRQTMYLANEKLKRDRRNRMDSRELITGCVCTMDRFCARRIGPHLERRARMYDRKDQTEQRARRVPRREPRDRRFRTETCPCRQECMTDLKGPSKGE